jgi:hypothetical protein
MRLTLVRRKMIEYVLWFLAELHLRVYYHYHQLEHQHSEEPRDTNDLCELHVTSHYQQAIPP